METMFKYESNFFPDIHNFDLCRRFQVCLYVTPKNQFEGDVQVNIYCEKTGKEFQPEEFPENEQAEIKCYIEEHVMDVCQEWYENGLDYERAE